MAGIPNGIGHLKNGELPMLGPKLDARSYAILVLAAIAVVVSSTLVAQQFDLSPSARSSVGATIDVAEANREIARALQEIAKSNQEIAGAITSLSRSVSEVKDAIGDLKVDRETAAVEAPSAPSPRAVDEEADPGVFELGN